MESFKNFITEGQLKVGAWTGKKPPPGIKIVKKTSSSFGGYDTVFSGPDAKLIAFAKRSLGAEKSAKTLADVQSMVEGKEEYIMKKGSFTRKVDGKSADKMKRQGWKLVGKE